jgi:hypothetical protein
MRHVALPPYLPAVPLAAPAALPELALELYRKVAAATREAEQAQQAARQEVEKFTREAGRVLARLAAARFELERLLARLRPELAAAGRDDLGRVLDLFARGWDAELERSRVEVRDVTGLPMTDELAQLIEVEGAVPDVASRETTVRETLAPLVLWAGRVVGVARVITSVPGADNVAREAALAKEEEP